MSLLFLQIVMSIIEYHKVRLLSTLTIKYMNYIDNILVSDQFINEIKKVIGYPVVNEEFSTIVSDDDIKSLIIGPTLETFYTYFPIKQSLEISVSGGELLSEIECPQTTLGLVRAQFVSQSSTIQGNLMQTGSFYGNPFFSASQVLSQGSSAFSAGSGRFGTSFKYSFETSTYQRKFYTESIEGSNKAYRIHYNENNNTLEVKSSIAGIFYIELALWSNDTDLIPMRRRQNVIKYAQGLLLQHFAGILKMTEADLPSSLDADFLNEKGNTLLEEVLTYWREASTFQVMR